MRAVLDRLIPLVAALVMKTIHTTLRIRHVYPDSVGQLFEQRSRFVMAFWHGHLLMMVFARYPRPIMTMTSRHRDGDLIARTVRFFGASAARGSTTRGGSSALRTMIEGAREGFTLAITPDGPRGPRHVAQMGVIQVAQATGLPIVPTAFIAERRKILRSWDRFEIPHLFSRGIFAYGEPIIVERRQSKEEMEIKRVEVEQSLNRIADEAEARFATLWEGGKI